MNRPNPIVALGAVGIAVFLLLQSANATPVVTSVTPQFGKGVPVSIVGNGFLPVNTVNFINRNSGDYDGVAFLTVNDTNISATSPTVTGFTQWLVSMFTPTDATLAIPADYILISTTTTASTGSELYVVLSGGHLTLRGGSCTVFVESGGSVINGGGSGNFFVQSGASYSLSNGSGSNTVYYETGANINFDTHGGGDNIFFSSRT